MWNYILVSDITGMSLAAYLTPWLVAYLRKVPNQGSVAVINILLGWSVVGWVVALAMACRTRPAYAAVRS